MVIRHGSSQFSSLGAAGGGTGEGVGAGLGDSVAPARLGDAVTVAVGWLPAQAATLTRKAATTIGLKRRRHHGVLTIPSLHYLNTNNSTLKYHVISRAPAGPPLVHGERPRSGWHREAWATIAASDDSLFDRIDVLGMREATVHLSAHAVRHGLAAVLPAEFDHP